MVLYNLVFCFYEGKKTTIFDIGIFCCNFIRSLHEFEFSCSLYFTSRSYNILFVCLFVCLFVMNGMKFNWISLIWPCYTMILFHTKSYTIFLRSLKRLFEFEKGKPFNKKNLRNGKRKVNRREMSFKIF